MSDAWQPRYLVRKAPGVGGPPIPEDEPVVVIRAQDKLALALFEMYQTWYEDDPDADLLVITDLDAHKDELVRWRHENAHKIKTADR